MASADGQAFGSVGTVMLLLLYRLGFLEISTPSVRSVAEGYTMGRGRNEEGSPIPFFSPEGDPD